MPRGLVRYQSSGQSHFVTFSCRRRTAHLRDPRLCEIFLATFEAARLRFSLRVYGYVLMPEHVHLLLSEPEQSTLADAIHFLKLSSAKRSRRFLTPTEEGRVLWEKRYYDRNIRSYSDFTEKLRYIHRNPVKRGLCASPDEWPWSSFRHYALREFGTVEIESEWTARLREMGATNPG